MKVATCCCCGQIIPPCLPFANRPVSRRVYEFVTKHPEGVSSGDIASHVYADDPDGGPGDAATALKAIIWRMNRDLKVLGIRIRATHGRGAIYRLVKADA